MDYKILYEYYRSLLGNIPEFLKKYLEIDILVRLKDISILCAMDYASKDIYDFGLFISRFDHSLNTALITWKLTKSKEATLAALFHDIATPIFSHVIDYMNGDYKKQESTEEYTREILLNSSDLRKLLEIDGIDIYDILDFKEYSIVDLPRPKLCADRIDGLITSGINWMKNITKDDIKRIVDSLIVEINENREEEIALNNPSIGEYLVLLNNEYDQLTHSGDDFYMMDLASRIIRKCLNLGMFTYRELFIIGEHEAIERIENESFDYELDKLWLEFKTKKKGSTMDIVDVKKKSLNPMIFKTRLNNL